MLTKDQEYYFQMINPDHTCKAYLIRPINSSSIALIDPQLEHLQDYIDIIEQNKYTLKYIFDTHTHADHISAAAALKEKYKEVEPDLVMSKYSQVRCVSLKVQDEMEINFEGIPIKILETPGHTLDSISLIILGKFFTGDSLFLGEAGAGRDDLPGGSPEQHWISLEKIKRLPDNLIVYPAHEYRGRQPTTLGEQKQTNPYLKFTNQEAYVEYLSDLVLGPADWMKDVLKANYQCTQDPKSAWVPLDSPACESLGTLDPSLEKYSVKAISPLVFSQILKDNKDYILLDVRSEKELSGKLGTIPEANHIPLSSIMNDISQLLKWRDKKIITICGSGKRAEIAARILKKLGFQNLLFVEGGIKKWKGIKLNNLRAI
ncbi:MAG: MBL fold metallo-hydrolase [Candidatus Lokiarchaeota archaeon]|nr:MBL fold metallo-hydrolase [Candidatus Harpocratesius repetitus]